MMKIRDANSKDFEQIMKIYKYAQDYMIQSGNPTQMGYVHCLKVQTLHMNILKTATGGMMNRILRFTDLPGMVRSMVCFNVWRITVKIFPGISEWIPMQIIGSCKEALLGIQPYGAR